MAAKPTVAIEAPISIARRRPTRSLQLPRYGWPSATISMKRMIGRPITTWGEIPGIATSRLFT